MRDWGYLVLAILMIWTSIAVALANESKPKVEFQAQSTCDARDVVKALQVANDLPTGDPELDWPEPPTGVSAFVWYGGEWGDSTTTLEIKPPCYYDGTCPPSAQSQVKKLEAQLAVAREKAEREKIWEEKRKKRKDFMLQTLRKCDDLVREGEGQTQKYQAR